MPTFTVPQGPRLRDNMHSEAHNSCDEKQQVEVIQRIGRVGYWEYDAQTRKIYVPSTSLDLLHLISGMPASSANSLLDVLSGIERRRLQTTLDHAATRRLDFNVEFKVDNPTVEVPPC